MGVAQRKLHNYHDISFNYVKVSAANRGPKGLR
jgi:hypothetical protein